MWSARFWQIFGRPDIGPDGLRPQQSWIDYNYVSNEFDAWATVIVMDVLALDQPCRAALLRRLNSISRCLLSGGANDGASRWAYSRIQLPR